MEDKITPCQEGFNAAKTGKIPESFHLKPPAKLPAVKVAYFGRTVGYGLVAARDFEEGEFIIHEKPLLRARYNENRNAANQDALAVGQYREYRQFIDNHDPVNEFTPQEVIAVAYPYVAAQHGIQLPPWDRFKDILDRGLSKNLVDGLLAPSDIKEKHYKKIRAAANVNHEHTEQSRMDACRDFFRGYAFMSTNSNVPAGSKYASTTDITVRAQIYLLASLINHCCNPEPEPLPGDPSQSKSTSLPKWLPSSLKKLKKPKSSASLSGINTAGEDPTAQPPPPDDPVPRRIIGPNCEFRISSSALAKFIKPHHIAVQARRAIRAGEQLTWNYGRDKNRLGFTCECDTCRSDIPCSLL